MKFVMMVKAKETDELILSKPADILTVLSASRWAKKNHIWFKIRRYKIGRF